MSAGTRGNQKKKERRKKKKRERKRRDKLKGKIGFSFVLLKLLAGTPRSSSVLHLLKVISWDFFPWNFSSICWDVKYIDFPIYFMKKVIAFTFWKLLFISVFEHSFHTRNCFDWFGSCGSPNREYDGFLESPICLVCCPKMSANDSLYFGSYRSWSEVCSQEIRTRVTNFAIFFEGFKSVNEVILFPRFP